MFLKIKIIILSVVLLMVYSAYFSAIEVLKSDFEVTFLNVNQGDSILIKTPRNRLILIDGGRGIKIITELEKLIPLNKKTIDILIATHMDVDHIGGLIHVFNKYQINNTILNNSGKQNKTINKLKQQAGRESTVRIINKPIKITIDNVILYILWPIKKQKNENDSSIVVYATYGEAEVFLSGDATKGVEQILSNRFNNLLTDIEVIKAGHHGSKTSTSKEFLNITNPDFFIISAGENNQFGHPHKEVIQLAEQYDTKILETKNGSITFKSARGENLKLK